jgi:hypothetical protein
MARAIRAAAIVGAMFRYFHLDPQKATLPTNKIRELLAGDHAGLPTQRLHHKASPTS